MRMRKKKWALPFLEDHPNLALFEPVHKGNWQELLKTNSINIEIGFGKGKYLQQMAQQHLSDGWIGIEKDENCVAVALKHSLPLNITNMLMIAADAYRIDEWFDIGEVDNIFLNFSDPWPKNGHKKRRLSSTDFIQKYDDILKSNGKIIMKTDNRKLFEFSLVSLLDYGFKLSEVNVDFRSEAQDDPMTEYEQKFIELQQPIYKLVVIKPGGKK